MPDPVQPTDGRRIARSWAERIEREEVLHSLRILETIPELAFESSIPPRILQQYGQIVRMQMAIVPIVNPANRSNLKNFAGSAYDRRAFEFQPGIDMLLQSAATASYDRRTIALHWLTAVLVIGLWLVGQTVDWFPKGVVRTSARSAHIVCGALLGALIIYRIWWRVTGGKRLPPADEGLLRTVSTFTHRALYLLVCLTVALGITNAWIRGDSIFGLFRIPSFAPLDKALRDSIEDYHGLSANVLIALAGIHALAGLFHHYIRKDGVLRRMIPFGRG